MEGYGSLIDWLVFFAIILGLIYTMFVIKEEKNSFLESAISRKFKFYDLLIPSWWGQTIEEENRWRFERTDTRYDWKATYTWLPFKEGEEDKIIEDKFKELIHERKIIFDPDTGTILNPSDVMDHPALKDGDHLDMVRIEGMATEDEVERVYYDAFMLKDYKNQGFLYCESRSSILNGLVEGPYFEETIFRVTLSK